VNTRVGDSDFYPIIVDLVTGDWQNVDACFAPASAIIGWGDPYRASAGYHELVVEGPELAIGMTDTALRFRAGATGRLRTADYLDAIPDELRPALRRSVRATTPWRLPDGRRIWCFDRRLEYDGRDGTIESVDVGFVSDYRGGVVSRVYQRRSFYDVGARLSVAWDQSWENVWILRDLWLVRSRDGSRVEYRLFDPKAKTTRPARGLEPTDRALIEFDDGTVLVGTEPKYTCLANCQVDPVSGSRRELHLGLDGLAEIDPESVAWSGLRWRTPSGQHVFRVHLIHEPRAATYLVRYDAHRKQFAVARFPVTRPIAFPDDDHAIALRGGAIYRVEFGSDSAEKLFPRPDGREQRVIRD